MAISFCALGQFNTKLKLLILVPFGLRAIHVGIFTVLGNQTVMRSLFHNLTVLEYQYAVRQLRGAQSV